MASFRWNSGLDGLPPLPKSLSGFTSVGTHSFSSGSYFMPLDKNSASCEISLGKNYSSGSENGNFFPTSIRGYSGPSEYVVVKSRATPPLRESTPTLGFKQLTDPGTHGSSRASPVINSSRTTPLSSARGSPIGSRSSTSPVSGLRGNTPPGNRGLPPPPPPPRQHHFDIQNGLDKSCALQLPRPGRTFNLDTQLANLRKEMFSLRQMDLSLLNQLWALNEAVQEFRSVQEENAALSPPSPPSCDESDEFYSPLSSRGYPNMPRMPLNPSNYYFESSHSSSDNSIEFLMFDGGFDFPNN